MKQPLSSKVCQFPYTTHIVPEQPQLDVDSNVGTLEILEKRAKADLALLI